MKIYKATCVIYLELEDESDINEAWEALEERLYEVRVDSGDFEMSAIPFEDEV